MLVLPSHPHRCSECKGIGETTALFLIRLALCVYGIVKAKRSRKLLERANFQDNPPPLNGGSALNANMPPKSPLPGCKGSPQKLGGRHIRWPSRLCLTHSLRTVYKLQIFSWRHEPLTSVNNQSLLYKLATHPSDHLTK